jgi:hypothetical protein
MNIEIDDRKVKLNRVVGGLGWPSDLPGFVAILGEEIFNELPFPRTGEERRYHVLDGMEEPDMEELIKGATALKGRYHVEIIYGRPKATKGQELPAMHFLNQWNVTSFREGRTPLYLTDAPFTEDRGLLAFHLNILKGLLRPENRRLFIPPTSVLNGRLREIPENVTNLKDVDCPAVAALAYAASALRVWREDLYEPEDLVPPYLGEP